MPPEMQRLATGTHTLGEALFFGQVVAGVSSRDEKEGDDYRGLALIWSGTHSRRVRATDGRLKNLPHLTSKMGGRGVLPVGF